MDDVLNIMMHYGDVREKLAVAEKDVTILRAEKEILEKKIERLVRENDAMKRDNLLLLSWNNDMRRAVLEFCAAHQLQMTLPQQPSLSVTNNYAPSTQVDNHDGGIMKNQWQ